MPRSPSYRTSTATTALSAKAVLGALAVVLLMVLAQKLAAKKVVGDVNDAPPVTFTTTSVITLGSFPPSTATFAAN